MYGKIGEDYAMYKSVEQQKSKKANRLVERAQPVQKEGEASEGIVDKRTMPTVQTLVQRRRHRAMTYVVTVTHPDANGGETVVYYRDNVNGHGAQAAVVRAAMRQFAITYPNLQGAPARAGRPLEGDAPDGAIAV